MPVGVVTALPLEASWLPDGPPGVRPLCRVGGPGEERARRAAQALLRSGATHLVSWGLAGGIHPELPRGTLLLPRFIRGTSTFSSHGAWRSRLAASLSARLRVEDGDLLHSASPVASARTKRALFQDWGACGVDQESA
ncbi:MAG TPA: phosphorylase, partial [Gammaproteobacteria bacterium]|nr:phosphorylase [Gammaproteobacteria bacterium]